MKYAAFLVAPLLGLVAAATPPADKPGNAEQQAESRTPNKQRITAELLRDLGVLPEIVDIIFPPRQQVAPQCDNPHAKGQWFYILCGTVYQFTFCYDIWVCALAECDIRGDQCGWTPFERCLCERGATRAWACCQTGDCIVTEEELCNDVASCGSSCWVSTAPPPPDAPQLLDAPPSLDTGEQDEDINDQGEDIGG